jgi:glycosyltransferase involved in cell wall biosynthesis
VPEVVNSSEVGILVEPNVAAMAKGLEDALSKDWDRSAIARFARSRSWNEVAAEMEAFFADQMSSSEAVKSLPTL